MVDALFINPSSSAHVYQDLAKTYSAIEPPTWALLLAESCRAKDFDVGILDSDAERLDIQSSVKRVIESEPRLVVFVVYGQNPNSGTTNMIGALALAEALKESGLQAKIAFVGSHTSALPKDVLSYDCVDIALLNEGVYALHNLLAGNLDSDLMDVRGIGYKPNISGQPVLNPPEKVVPQECMDQDMPGYAWDLLPYREYPLDLYRAHFWHADFDHEKRTPFAAIYTALGCNFACNFCMINIVNRMDNGDEVSAADSRGMRFWSTDWVIREMRKLSDMGVKTLRISDEMFFLNRKHYHPILERCIEEKFDFNMWAYARVDTIRERELELFKQAGVNWLALGVESGNQVVRQQVSKGTFRDVNIRKICKMIQSYDIKIISNFIFGFPEDTLETMQDTLDLAIELNTEMANMYPCQALPGSPIYFEAKRNNWKLPESYDGYAFLSYHSTPLPTRHVSAAEVLKFRDYAWQQFFTNPDYLNMIEGKLGIKERNNIENMAKIKLKRRILGD
ncbi:B12-binding domain-containing radical SAM protein [Vibrio spartinae]|uniref:Coproporphyrinogen III oxidase n=1 Tax=Vibrio spartinae TaxID=1918945 RepID=A0A1N6M2U4_9VIBR|nr:radical SAM protein [Vibrio spartinae]QMV12994.1 coproporphyrinogen III oxidase [Vibrio spartinae]SIO93700.1 coproporphyrinogen III oxidase [Vibrio spartinae]